jgi:hypothetical protein
MAHRGKVNSAVCAVVRPACHVVHVLKVSFPYSGRRCVFSKSRFLLVSPAAHTSMCTNAHPCVLFSQPATPPSLASLQAFVATGGDDGRLCLWSRRTRELLLQFSEHVKPVLAVTLDVQAPSRVHTVGADRSVFTVDLKSERRVVAHQVRMGNWMGRKGGEVSDVLLLSTQCQLVPLSSALVVCMRTSSSKHLSSRATSPSRCPRRTLVASRPCHNVWTVSRSWLRGALTAWSCFGTATWQTPQ